jgi:RNA polymerase sigma-70 factor, ECF subfamily
MGVQRARGQSLDLCQYEDFLRLMARTTLDARLRGLLDPSDLVQETLLKAHAKFHQFRGSTPGELRAWLRAIMANEMALAVRRLVGRGESLEESFQAILDESSGRLEAWLADDKPEPGDQALREERLLLLMRAVEQLPHSQRQAIELRYLQGYAPPEVARRMRRSKASAAGLLRRGLGALRDALGDNAR